MFANLKKRQKLNADGTVSDPWYKQGYIYVGTHFTAIALAGLAGWLIARHYYKK